ncbi:CAP domain-containing protein [Candidatus Saccharibacteria bacterium]|nr:CAP domain-containing protein [Candidatus Saccharibacteria bacterium]
MPARTKQTPLHARVRRTTKRHVKMAMVPHRENQYKPHLIRRHGLLVICVVVLLVQLITNLNYFRNILGTENQVSVADLLVDTNTERQKAGLEPLTLDTRLSDAAYMKAKDMLANEYWSHSSPTGVQPWKWLGDADYNYSYAGENLARNFNSSRGVVSAWMASPSHRENILKKQYQDVGFATVDGTMDGRPI